MTDNTYDLALSNGILNGQLPLWAADVLEPTRVPDPDWDEIEGGPQQLPPPWVVNEMYRIISEYLPGTFPRPLRVSPDGDGIYMTWKLDEWLVGVFVGSDGVTSVMGGPIGGRLSYREPVCNNGDYTG